MNEEVLISLRANVKPFNEAMKQAVQNVDYATQQMVDFNSQVDNANKKQLKNIASKLQSEINQTTLIIKNMQKELVIATQTKAPTGFTQGLRNDIMVAKNELNSLNKKMDILKGKGITAGGVFTKAMSGISNGFKGIGKAVLNFGKQFGGMINFSIMFGAIGVLRNGLTQAKELSESATGNFTGMANVIAGALVPVVEAFANAIRKAFVWVAGLINFLSGGKINLIQKGIDATNKKISKLGTSAKKSGKQMKDGMLSGLDEINNIEQADGGSGGGASAGADMSAQVGALGSLNDMMAEMQALDFSWAEPLKAVFQFISENWEFILVGILALVAAFTTYSIIMGIVNAVMYASPVTWIVVAIAALVAIIIVCIAYWDEIKVVVQKVVNAIVDWVKNLVSKIGEFFTNLWNSITTWFSNLITAIGQFFSNILNGLINFLKSILDGIVGIFQSIVNWVKDNWQSILLFLINPFAGIFNYLYENSEKFRNFIDGIVQAVKNFFISLGQKISEVATNAWNWIVNVFQGMGNWFGARIADVINFFKNLPENIRNFFQTAWNNITNIFKNLGGWFGDRVNDVINFFRELPNKVWTFIKGLWDKITGLFGNIGSTIGDAISGAVKGAINSVLKGAVNIINGFINAINLAIGVINAIPGVSIKKLSKLSVPSFDVGTNYVPQDMIAQIHKGERIVPAKYNNDDWVSDDVDMTETNSLLEQLINVVASKNFTIGKDDIGRASVDYILAENRRRGGSII